MRRKLLAAASLAAVSGLAAAQSNVTVYGIVDANYTYNSGGDRHFAGVDSGGISGSRLGFRGSEELGNGLKAIFTLEYGLKVDTNTGVASARQQFVGLQSNRWGTVMAGYVYSPADDFNSDYDGLSNSGLLSARSNMLNDGGFSTKTDDTFQNAVGYISPEFGGVTLRAVVGKGEQTVSPRETKLALGAEYKAGPFKAAILHHDVDNIGGTLPKRDLSETVLGAAYDFKVAMLMATYASKKLTDRDRDNTWSVGARVPVGNGSVRLSYAKLDMSADNGNKDASGWTVAYFHDLSKRTTLYTGYHALNNASLANYDHEQVKGLTAGDNARLFTVGMRHRF
ncbi:porin [Azospira restricta]|uniref:Porin n=1 Tax=Azospira restricta TaxID=404405 RepID=A0A974PXM2_9RHOO|nr:porin [Azospira restricta]QRJ63270.1 porin [Azospira restricta]